MSHIIVVTSGKGGVGKTTVTANLGFGLASLHRKVIVIDTDIGLRNLDVVMGLENKIIHNLVDVIEGRCLLHDALIKDERYNSLYLLAAAQTRDKTSVTPQQMTKLVQMLNEQADYIIIDSPAGIEQGFQNAIAPAELAIVVTTPEVSSIRDADRVIGLLKQHHISQIRLIINRMQPAMVRKGDMMSEEDIVEILATDLLGVITNDEKVVIASNSGIPLTGIRSRAGSSLLTICDQILLCFNDSDRSTETALTQTVKKRKVWKRLFTKN